MSSYRSETSRNGVRDLVIEKWIYPAIQNGLDLGAGGDPISVYSIAVDLPHPYAATHDELERSYPQHLRGDARELWQWFVDECLDYVYSSHLLEDFENTHEVLREWLRVLKPGGRLVLLLPNQQQYEDHCEMLGQEPNGNHKVSEMSREYIEDVLETINTYTGQQNKLLYSVDIPPYSFLIVAEKL